MNLLKKIITVFLFFFCISNVYASDTKYSFLNTDIKPSNIPESFVMGYSSSSSSGNSEALYYYDNGVKTQYLPIFKVNSETQQSLYCLEANEGAVKRGNVFRFKGLVDDQGLAYLINNKNGNGWDSKQSYTINQFAVWFYMHEVWGESHPTTSSPRYSAKTGAYAEPHIYMMNYSGLIADNAKKFHDSYVEPSMEKLEISSNVLTIKDNYLISDEITVPLTNIDEYEVIVDNGIVIDSNGKEKYKFGKNEKFRVKVENKENTTVNITVNSQYEKKYVPVYNDTTDVNSQDVILPTVITKTIKLSKKLKLIYAINNTIEFSKIDVTTGKELPGATLIIRDSNNKEIERWVSTNEVHKVKLNPGTYTLEEIIAPEGYILSAEKVEFTVKEDGTCDRVVMENKINSITVSKRGVSTNEELPGATLVLLDDKENVIEEWVSEDKPHVIKKLKVGKYFIKEIKAPKGYAISENILEFVVNEDGTINPSELTFYNGEIDVPMTASDISIYLVVFCIFSFLSGLILLHCSKSI